MDMRQPILKDNNVRKDSKFVMSTDILDLYHKLRQDIDSYEYAFTILHHNVQSISNKILDISMMLTVENLNINILFYLTLTERRSNECCKH